MLSSCAGGTSSYTFIRFTHGFPPQAITFMFLDSLYHACITTAIKLWKGNDVINENIMVWNKMNNVSKHLYTALRDDEQFMHPWLLKTIY